MPGPRGAPSPRPAPPSGPCGGRWPPRAGPAGAPRRWWRASPTPARAACCTPWPAGSGRRRGSGGPRTTCPRSNPELVVGDPLGGGTPDLKKIPDICVLHQRSPPHPPVGGGPASHKPFSTFPHRGILISFQLHFGQLDSGGVFAVVGSNVATCQTSAKVRRKLPKHFKFWA